MARDVGLMSRARATGETVFSVYGWLRPTLSLGRNQRAAGGYDVERMQSLGVDAVRRPTGGRALLHNREATYSVTAPLRPRDTPGAAYARINAILLNGLRILGVDAFTADSPGQATLPTNMPCFATPARGELVTGGRKLVGSAQWSHQGVLLQHGSILIEDDQPIIASLSLGSSAEVPMTHAATLASALGRTPTVAEIASALFDSVRELEDQNAASLDESEVEELTFAELPRFENELWTWRR